MKTTVVGAGMIGLCTAMLLSDDGHEVLILERDPAPPPGPGDAWDRWDRRGVNQFRLAHFLLSRFRAVAEAELPRLTDGLEKAGSIRLNLVANIPDEMKGGARPDDDRFALLTGRRAVVEAVTALACADTPRVEIRRGVAVRGLLTGVTTEGPTPHVTGVELETGGRILCDLVVDTTGRRSPLPRWLEAAGARPPAEEVDESGFAYYGRHFRSADGSVPFMLGPPRQDYPGMSCLTLPADNGTWSVTLVASSSDSAMRAALDPDRWAALVRILPLAAHWLDGEPIDEGVAFMGKIEDRLRDYVPAGRPVATGVVAVGDSWSCTNPSLGRGISAGLLHAVALRDTLRAAGGDPGALAIDFADLTRERVEPWYRTSVAYDRNRLAEFASVLEGRPFANDEPEWRLQKQLGANATVDGDFLRAFLEINLLIRIPADVLADGPLMDRLDRSVPGPGDIRPLGPSRVEMLAALAG